MSEEITTKKPIGKSKPTIFGLSGLSIVLLTIILVSPFSYSNFSETQQGLFSAQGHFTLVATDSEGNVKQIVQSPNLIVDIGIDTMGDLIFPDINLNANATDSKFDWLQIGTGTTAPVAGNTVLETPLGATNCRLQDATVTGTSAVSGEITVTVDVQFSGTNCAGAITEAGLFNSKTSGEMLARSTFSAINIASGDNLTITYEVTLT